MVSGLFKLYFYLYISANGAHKNRGFIIEDIFLHFNLLKETRECMHCECKIVF